MASAAPRHQFRPPDEPNDEAGDDQCDQEDAREHDPACRLVIRFCGCQHNVTLGVPLRCLTEKVAVYATERLMGEGRIGSFTKPIEHEAELKLQGELHRTTALAGRP